MRDNKIMTSRKSIQKELNKEQVTDIKREEMNQK